MLLPSYRAFSGQISKLCQGKFTNNSTGKETKRKGLDNPQRLEALSSGSPCSETHTRRIYSPSRTALRHKQVPGRLQGRSSRPEGTRQQRKPLKADTPAYSPAPRRRG